MGAAGFKKESSESTGGTTTKNRDETHAFWCCVLLPSCAVIKQKHRRKGE
jgi:hypothetical protein